MIKSSQLQRIAEVVMILGIVALCQPWVEVLHRYGLTVIIIGLVAFLITSHVPPEPEAQDEEEEELV